MIRSRRRTNTTGLFALVLILSSCAVPVAPTGGPVDKVAPMVASMTPGRDAVNVPADSKTIRFEFSEYMNESSFNQAFSISPEPDAPPKISWKRRVATVALSERLTPNTTYVLTLDTRLRDANGVAYANAKSFAFSTGNQVNRGKIAGIIVGNLNGKPIKGTDVFAYPLTDSIRINRRLPARPKYRTQTDEAGEFTFDYLTPGDYLILGLTDRNNNKRVDESERVALADTLFTTAKESGVSSLRMYSFVYDMTPPEMRRLRTISNARVALRYSEEIYPESMEGWSIRDSVTQVVRNVRQAYLSASDPREVVVVTEPLPATRHEVIPPSLPDSAGNNSASNVFSFTPGLDSDTSSTLFLAFLPKPDASTDSLSHVPPGSPFGIELNQYYQVEGSQNIRLFDVTDNRVAFLASTSDGRSYELIVDSLSRTGMLRMDLDGAAFGLADTVKSHFFDPMTTDDLGSLSGIALSASGGRVIVEAFPAKSHQRAGVAAADSTGKFEITSLTPQNYQLRIIDDQNLNGKWDSGTLSPLRSAEAITFSADTLSVRAKWESFLPDTVYVGSTSTPEPPNQND